MSILNINPTPELFRSSAQIIRERGLAREIVEDDDGHVCLMGACGLAAGHTPDEGVWMFRALDAMARELGEDTTLNYSSFCVISHFNDEELTDAEAAAQFLERVATSLE